MNAATDPGLELPERDGRHCLEHLLQASATRRRCAGGGACGAPGEV